MQFSTKFVCATREFSTWENHVPAPCFRKEFELGALEHAELTICGLGFYELYVNGQKITRGLLSPYISNPDHYLYYDHYDLTPCLVEGPNVIGVMLGNGMQNSLGGEIWDFHLARFRSAPKFALSFEAVQADGSLVSFDAADAGFVWQASPILLDDLRIGEIYDARLELGDWSSPGYDAAAWQPAIPAETPRGECKLCDIDPILPACELKPVAITPSKITHFPETRSTLPVIDIPEDEENRGGFLYDFGINTAGLCRIRIRNARKGQKLVLQYGEKLAEDGGLDLRSITFLPHRYNHRDIYICKGGDETYIPHFTYHGFRYCLVMGIEKEQATGELLTYVVMNTALKPRAAFECSDEVTNKLWNAAINSDLSNFYHFPTDCPHREKNAWTGDASVSAEQMIMALTPERNWREWMHNVRKAMNDEGELPGIVPTAGWGYGEGPAWDNVLVNIPYYTWLYRGDKVILQENATAILRYIHFLTTKIDQNGLIEFGLGDWCPAGRSLELLRTPLVFSSTVISIDFCQKAAKIFDVLQMRPQKLFAQAVLDELTAAARKQLVDLHTMTALGRCQTSQAMAIYYDVFTEAEKPLAVQQLLKMIAAEDNSFDCGILGLRVIFHVLSAYGHAELAYRMITKKEFPSYGYEIDHGATSLWEYFHRFERKSSSLNHHFFGDIISWFMRNLAGIQVNPYERDPNELHLRPKFLSALDYVKASYHAPAGEIKVAWRREAEEIFYKIEIAEGLSAAFMPDDGWQCDDGTAYRRIAESCEIKLIRCGTPDRYSRK